MITNSPDLIGTVIAVVSPFLYVSLLTASFIYLTRKKLNFQVALPLTLISSTLFVYITTLAFHHISIGLWATILVALAAIPFFILDKSRQSFLKDLFLTPGFAIFSILYVVLISMDWFKVVPLLADTTMHWAPHVLTMWLRDDFYTSPGVSIVNQGNYPPVIQLFELMWSRVAGIYKESLPILAMQILSFSMVLPFVSGLRWQKRKLVTWSIIILFVAIIMALPMVLIVSDFYSSLDVDTILAFVFMYGIYTAFHESKKFTVSGLIKLSLAITFLCLTKQIATVLAGVIAVIYIAGLIQSRSIPLKQILSKPIQQLKNNWKLFLIIIIAIAFPLICLKLWSMQIAGYTQPDPSITIFHLKLTDFSHLPGIIADKSGTAVQQAFSHNFVKHLFFDQAGLIINIVTATSYMQLALLFLVAMVIIGVRTRDKPDRKMVITTAILLILGWLGYCFVLYGVFLFGGMKDVEINNIDTGDRYLRTYLFAMALLLIMFFVRWIIAMPQNKKPRRLFYSWIIFIAIVGLLFNYGTIKNLELQALLVRPPDLASYNVAQIKTDLGKIGSSTNYTFSNQNKILVMATTDYERHYIQYNALPDHARITLLIPSDMSSQDLVCNKLRTNYYFIVGNYYTDHDSLSKINDCLSAPMPLTQGDIYTISTDNNGFVTLKDMSDK
jgi:hypothetical protein